MCKKCFGVITLFSCCCTFIVYPFALLLGLVMGPGTNARSDRMVTMFLMRHVHLSLDGRTGSSRTVFSCCLSVVLVP